MSLSPCVGFVLRIAPVLACAACLQPSPPKSEPLPPMPAEEIVTVLPPRTITTVKDSAVRRISVHATDTDVRSLVMGIAAQGGLNVVVSPEVRSRVSIWVDDVSPLDALTAVMKAAHLSLAPTKFVAPWGPVVFFQPPVNLDSMSAAQIQKRFDLMRETAEFIVQTRQAQKP